MCGNGIRCMARFLIDKKLAESGKVIKIDTRAGLKFVEFLRIAGPEGHAWSVEWLVKVNMGNAIFEPEHDTCKHR